MKKALLTLFFAIASRSYAVEFGDIPADYTLYSAGDPFAIALATNNAAVKMNINNGTSTNQTLRLPLVADHLSFSLGTAPALGAGEIAWDPDWLTFKAGLSNGVEGQFFQEHHIVAKNAWTNTIPNGWVVMHSGVVGNSGKYEVIPAISTPALDPTRVIGMATEDIPVGALGRITARGNVNQIGSDGSLYGASGWQNNTPVYLCTTHVGWVTTNLIQAPYPRIYIGNIVRAHSSGAIYIRVQPGLRLADLDDVDGTPLTATGQFPVYDSVRGVFDFDRNVSEFLLASAFGTWTSTNKVSRLSDLVQPSRYFMALENGTGTVYEIAGPYTNFTVTLSSDFLELDTNTRPAWTNNVFPFTDGNWLGFESSGSFYITHSGGAVWEQPGTSIPATLSAVNIAAGSASIVVSNVYYTTNAIRHFATESELTQAKAECGAALTNLVNAATNALMPYTQTVYGDFATTNETGYAAFVVANPASPTAVVAVPPLTGATNTYSFSYPVQSGRFVSARCVAYANLGGNTTVSRSVLSLFDGLGNLLTSNVFDAVDSGNDILPYFTNSVSLATAMTNGLVLRLAITVGKASSVAPHTLYTGGSTPMSLSVNYVPTPYATQSDLANYTTFAQVTNIAQSVGGGISSIAQPIRFSETNVVIAATNAVYYVALTNAANVSFDFSALSLGGTKHASATVYLDCLNTQALASVFNTNSVTFDMPWGPTVTGRYEIAVKSEGTRITASQAWPKTETAQLGYSKYNYAGTPSTFPDLSVIADGATNGAVYTWVSCPDCWYAVRAQFSGGNESDTVTFGYYRFVLGYADFISPVVTRTVVNPGAPYGFSSGWVVVPPPTPSWLGGPGFANGVGLWITRSSSSTLMRCTVLETRKANILEIKAAQAAGY